MMKKILIVFNSKEPYRYNRRIHYDFIKKLDKFSDIKVITNHRKNKIDLKREYDVYKPDIVLHYHMKYFSKRSIYYIPYKKLPCLQILLICDYFVIKGKDQKKDKIDYFNKFDFIIHRSALGYLTSKEDLETQGIWLPFSADKNIFKFENNEDRINKIGFCGSYKKGQREKAINLLKRENLLVPNSKNKRIVGDNYINFLKKYNGYLTSVTSKTPHGKMFEIISSGGILLSPTFYREEEMFDDVCFVKYKDDCSDIIEKAKWILDNPKECEEIRKNAYNEFLKKHTDDIRVKDLYNSLKDLYNGRKIT